MCNKKFICIFAFFLPLLVSCGLDGKGQVSRKDRILGASDDNDANARNKRGEDVFNFRAATDALDVIQDFPIFKKEAQTISTPLKQRLKNKLQYLGYLKKEGEFYGHFEYKKFLREDIIKDNDKYIQAYYAYVKSKLGKENFEEIVGKDIAALSGIYKEEDKQLVIDYRNYLKSEIGKKIFKLKNLDDFIDNIDVISDLITNREVLLYIAMYLHYKCYENPIQTIKWVQSNFTRILTDCQMLEFLFILQEDLCIS